MLGQSSGPSWWDKDVDQNCATLLWAKMQPPKCGPKWGSTAVTENGTTKLDENGGAKLCTKVVGQNCTPT